MKKLSFILSFVVAIVGAFAFKPVDAEKLAPSFITLYEKPGCVAKVCGPLGTISCQDLFNDATTCISSYQGNDKRNP